MKAQHRKELQTNALADRLGHLLDSSKSGPNRTTLVVIGLIVVAVALILGFKYYSDTSTRKSSELWLKVEDAKSLDDLKAVAADPQNSGTVAARVARLLEARTLLKNGLEKLFSTLERADAIKNIETARDLFDKVAAESTDNPIMAQEALMGAAKARESLGNVDEAVGAYQKLGKAYPESALGKEAATRAARLEADRDGIAKFYADLNSTADSGKK